MIEEIIDFVVTAAIEVLLDGELIKWGLGAVGVLTAWTFSWGRASWDYDEWRSVLLGGVVTACLGGGGLAWWLSSGSAVT